MGGYKFIIDSKLAMSKFVVGEMSIFNVQCLKHSCFNLNKDICEK